MDKDEEHGTCNINTHLNIYNYTYIFLYNVSFHFRFNTFSPLSIERPEKAGCGRNF